VSIEVGLRCSLVLQSDGALTAQAYVSGSALETRYYYAGGQRVAMRQGGELHYLLGGHPSG
jgi:hypothetical protein